MGPYGEKLGSLKLLTFLGRKILKSERYLQALVLYWSPETKTFIFLGGRAFGYTAVGFSPDRERAFTSLLGREEGT